MMAHNLCYTTLLLDGVKQAEALNLEKDVDYTITPNGGNCLLMWIEEEAEKGLIYNHAHRLLCQDEQTKGNPSDYFGRLVECAKAC